MFKFFKETWSKDQNKDVAHEDKAEHEVEVFEEEEHEVELAEEEHEVELADEPEEYEEVSVEEEK